MVGHSLGCLLINFWAQQASDINLRKIKGALLVTPADCNHMAMNYKQLISWINLPMMKMSFRSIVFGSRNDKCCKIEMAEEFAKKWGNKQ